MTLIEQAVLSAIGEAAAQKAAKDEVSIAALKSALDDLIVEQTRLQQEERRLREWLYAISTLTGEKGLDDAKNLAAVALHEARHWLPTNGRGK